MIGHSTVTVSTCQVQASPMEHSKDNLDIVNDIIIINQGGAYSCCGVVASTIPPCSSSSLAQAVWPNLLA